MTTIFFFLIIIACAVLAFFVLIQNPKGGGLAGSFGGIGTQMMGAKQSTDVVEKGTWITAACVLAFTLVSFIITPKTNVAGKTRSEEVNKGIQAPKQAAPTPAPASAQPSSAAPAPAGAAPAATPPAESTPAQPATK